MPRLGTPARTAWPRMSGQPDVLRRAEPSLISGIDTTSLVSGFGGGIGTGANGAWPALPSKGGLMRGNTTVARAAFSGRGFESSEGNVFSF